MSIRVIGAAPEQTLARVEQLDLWLNRMGWTLAGLILAGLLASFTSTVYLDLAQGAENPYAEVLAHLAYSLAGVAVCIGLGQLMVRTHPARKWLRIAIPLAFFAVLLMMALVAFTSLGITKYGAQRWLHLGPLSFQPSELLKVAIVLYLAQLLCWWRRQPEPLSTRPCYDWRNPRDRWRASLDSAERRDAGALQRLQRLLTPPKSLMARFGLQRETAPHWPELPKRCMLAVLAAIGLTAIQPDLGTTGVILGASVVTIGLAGVRLRDLAALLLVICTVGGLVMIAAPEFYSYAEKRIQTWIHPLANDDSTAYQITQSRGALAAGGLLGRGYLHGEQKMNRLPLSTKDFIYPVLVEELGFAGGIAIIAMFLWLGYAGMRLGQACEDPFNQVAIPALGLTITLQALVNIGTTLGTLPLSGMTLPFLSNGGSSLIVSICSIGLMLALARAEMRAGDRELARIFG